MANIPGVSSPVKSHGIWTRTPKISHPPTASTGTERWKTARFPSGTFLGGLVSLAYPWSCSPSPWDLREEKSKKIRQGRVFPTNFLSKKSTARRISDWTLQKSGGLDVFSFRRGSVFWISKPPVTSDPMILRVDKNSSYKKTGINFCMPKELAKKYVVVVW